MLNVSGINSALNIDGPNFIEEGFLEEELNTGNWGISGWNHTEEAKKQTVIKIESIKRKRSD